MNESRDIELASAPERTSSSVGRNVIAVIGIDRYRHWGQLANAVRDARGAAELFQRLGFEQATSPLLNEQATGKAIHSLVTDKLRGLGPDDSLILFYAGHGRTREHRLGDQVIKTGYLIPFDASDAPDELATWIELESWLRAVAVLPAKHILVILDACYSGIALAPIIKWRAIGSQLEMPLSTLQARRSRRIITSALDDQVALDSGPIHGHSLFTGCLIESLTGGIPPRNHGVTTGSELGLYVQQRVQTYPCSRQTPDFGTFEFDDRGEMVIPLMMAPSEVPEAIGGQATGRGPDMLPSATDASPTRLAGRGLAATVVGCGTLVIGSVVPIVVTRGESDPTSSATWSASRPASEAPVKLPSSPPPSEKPNPNAEVAVRAKDVLSRFLAWSHGHRGAPCPDITALGALPLDPWGHAFRLTCTDQPGDQIVGAISAGPDGAPGTADDIASWQLGRDITESVRGTRWLATTPRPSAPARSASKPSADAKPASKSSADAKPASKSSADAKPMASAANPVESRPAAGNPADAKPGMAKAAEVKSAVELDEFGLPTTR